MVPHRFHNEYRHNEVATSSQGKLIIMMYEGALKFVTLAIEGIATKDLSKKGIYINKTHDIINELSCALDMNKGGDVAHKLESLYQFILHQLTLANIKSDRKALESIVNVLTSLERVISQKQQRWRDQWPQKSNCPPTQENSLQVLTRSSCL